MNTNIKKACLEIIALNPLTEKDLHKLKRQKARQYNLPILKNSDIIKYYQAGLKNKKIKQNHHLEQLLKRRQIRTLSGIAPVAILTKPWPCPGNCAYCPTEDNVPQSYLSNEPAVMRAIRSNYNPYLQVQDRLRALEANGHEPTKIELIVIGGTWSYFPAQYKYWYIANAFAGANEFGKKKRKKEKYSANLKLAELKKLVSQEQKINEKTKYKIIGLTLETRPDYINTKELDEMRDLGCTRVEIGVQAIDDEILNLNQRGHGVAETIQATKMLRSYGFKITYHLMPGLPGATPKKDLQMFKQLFSDKNFQPDQIKFYPTVVTQGSLLYKWWQQGKYKPYSDQVLKKLIIDCKKEVPYYVRIIRLIRDIPAESIIAGNKITNLRQILKQEGVKCNCIRCREVKKDKIQAQLFIQEYNTSIGKEFFISLEDAEQKKLAGFCRLSLPDDYEFSPQVLQDKAIIRELHVYGELVPVGKTKKTQHSGLGKKLLAQAEKIAKQHGYKKIAIISGIGVRDYYRKQNYRLQQTYLIKNLEKNGTTNKRIK